MEAAVAVVPAGPVALLGGALHRGEQRLGLVVGAAALGREAGDGGLEQRARLEQVGRAGVVRLARALGGAGGDERARAGARLDHAGDLQRGDRLAHRGAADLEPAREVALGRQPLAGRQPAGADVGGDPVGDLLVALARPDRVVWLIGTALVRLPNR